MSVGTRRHLGRLSLLALVLLGGGWAYLHMRGAEVATVSLRRGPLVETLVTSGRVRPQRLRLSPLVGGRVAALEVEEGRRVAVDATLLTLDATEAEARVREVEAALERARLQRRRVGTLQRGQADALVTQAEARAAEARRDVERLGTLADRGAVPRNTLDEARTTLEVTESALREARTQRSGLERGGVVTRGADAEVRQAEAALALARARLDYTRLRAPLPGVVIALHTRLGDVVQAGATLIELAADAGTELLAALDERNLARLRLDQPALASAEAYPDRRFAAKLSFIAPAIDPERGTVEVRFSVEEAPEYLRPDMTVSIDVEVARRQEASTLPAPAVRDRVSDPHVLVVEGGRARRVPVQVGIDDGARVEVLHGLSADAVVIADPTVAPGDRVRARPGVEAP